MLLGCIADDFTGGGDIANTLAREGMATTLYCGPSPGPAAGAVEAGVVALKSRTIPAAEAVAQSLAALDWLLAQGCRQIVFKVCSTFDSTPAGNIGPVAEALARRLGAGAVVVCPAFPAAGRTLYMGHLFVGDRLLSESGMRRHPLTPMEDPDIRRWLARQTAMPVRHIPHPVVGAGPEAIRAALRPDEPALVVVDALDDDDLRAIGRAAAGLPLLTGGSGIAMGLPGNFTGRAGGQRAAWPRAEGPALVLAGSCSEATRAQVAAHAAAHPALHIAPDDLMAGRVDAAAVAEWAAGMDDAPLVYATDDPDAVRAAQDRHGAEALAARLEAFFADLARRAVERGIRRLVVAGGETSGAVAQGLGAPAIEIGPEIAPGVPAMRVPDLNLALVLKSGNFGGRDFFAEAIGALGNG